jgi:hypothetical protein
VIAPGLPLALDKRWRSRQQHWRSPEDVFDPRNYGVDIVRERDARAFVCEHHYSGSYPAARLALGLYRSRPIGGRELAGVAVFSVPVQERVIPAYTGYDPRLGVELGRFILLDDVRYNGETWMLRRAFAVLRAELPDVQAIVSYADPFPLPDADGRFLRPAHYGTIYQGSNSVFCGRTSAAHLLVSPNGTVVSRRALDKIRRGERGARGAQQRLRELGAPPLLPDETPAAWVARARTFPGFQTVRHPGNFVYSFGLTPKAKRAIADRFPYTVYPKKPEDSSHHGI